MELIKLDENVVSLELDEHSYPDALRALARFGAVDVAERVTYDLITVGSSEFIATEEWEGTALISKDKAGSDILRSVAETLEALPPQTSRRAA